MLFRQITDWDDAYSNGPHIAGGDKYVERWRAAGQAARERMAKTGLGELDMAYGEKPRNRLDLFRPQGEARGLVVFVHGGFWLRFDKNHWAQLAAGPLEAGYAVAMPGYTLCPENSVAGITREVAAAIEHAAGLVAGPVHLTGHSAGGHLVTRMVTTTSPLSKAVSQRIVNVVSISGVHDLRPMIRTSMNATLRLTEDEARAESPALLEPREGVRVTCWVGAAERAEFVRQNALLANAWTGLGAATATVEEPDRHHFDVIDGLMHADHPLTRTLLTA